MFVTRRSHRPTSKRLQAIGVIAAVSLTVVACGDRAGVSTPLDAGGGGEAAPAVPAVTAPAVTSSAVTAPPVETTPASTSVPTSAATTPSTSTPPSTSSTTVAPAPAPVIPVATGWAAFDQRLMRILDAGSSAVSATVMRDGEIVHEVALGTRTSAGDAVEVGDRYRVASISKVITAITALRLVDQGVIDLDAPVGDRLAGRVGQDSPASGVSAITPRHLLTHRSGIGQYESLMFDRQVESCPAAGAVALGRGLDRVPGTGFRYSNVNFCLLGELIEDATGMSYVDVVSEQLLAPLDIDGMRLAGTFDVGDGDVEHASVEGRNYMEVLDGAGSWIASPTDVVTIIDSLDETTPGWKPLSAAMNAEMRTITIDPPVEPEPTGSAADVSTTAVPAPPTSGYGMGLMIFGPDSYGHTGTLESSHAMTVRQPDGITWAITVSGDAPSSSRDLATIMNDAFGYGGFS